MITPQIDCVAAGRRLRDHDHIGLPPDDGRQSLSYRHMIVRDQNTNLWVALRRSAARQSYRLILPRSTRGKCHDDRGAVALGTPNGELTTHHLHTLLDAQQPESIADMRGIEAASVVMHLQTHSNTNLTRKAQLHNVLLFIFGANGSQQYAGAVFNHP